MQDSETRDKDRIEYLRKKLDDMKRVQRLKDQQYSGTMIADLIMDTENVLDNHSGK